MNYCGAQAHGDSLSGPVSDEMKRKVADETVVGIIWTRNTLPPLSVIIPPSAVSLGGLSMRVR